MAIENTAGTYSETFGDEYQFHLLCVLARIPGLVIRFRSALDHKYFASAPHRVIAKALLAYVDKYHGLPTQPTLAQEVSEEADKEVGKQAVDLSKQIWEKDVSDYEAVRDRIVEFGKQQAMIDAVLEASTKLEAGDRNIMQLIQQAQMVGEDVADRGIDWRTADRSTWYTTDIDYSQYTPTGITHLDRAFNGGFQRGCLYVILGSVKRGKSSALVNIGFGPLLIPDGMTTVHYSNEIIAPRIAMRYDARVAGPVWKYRNSEPEKFAVAVADRITKIVHGRLAIKSYPTRTCTIEMLRQHLNILRSEGINADRVIVDYADIMRGTRRLQDMRHEQAGIYEDLRGLAGEYNCDVVTASQAKVGALAKVKLDMSDFAEAFEKAAIMDAGIALCQTDDERLTNKCRFVVIGARDGQDGQTIECNINRPRCMIRSTGLFDEAGLRIAVPEDPEDAPPTMENPAPSQNEKIMHYGKNGKNGHGDKTPIKKITLPPSKIIKPKEGP